MSKTRLLDHPHSKKVILGACLALLLLVPPILILSPIWDAPPVDDSHLLRPEQADLPPEQNTFEGIFKLARGLNLPDGSVRHQWETKPDEHQEAIAAWLLAEGAFPDNLRAVMKTGSFQTPWVPDLNGDRYWVSDLLKLYNHLDFLTKLLADKAEALDLLHLQFDLLDHMTELPPDALIDALIQIAGAALTASSGQNLLYRFHQELSEEELISLRDLPLRLERLQGPYWMRALEHEYWMIKDVLQGPGSFWRNDIPSWMPWWSSYFFQPNLTQRHHLEALELNRAALQNIPPPPPWASIEEMKAILENEGLFGLRHYQNYIGKMIFYPVDYSKLVNRFVVTAQVLRVQAALLLHRNRHGEFPDSLSALVPDFLDAILLDPYDGNPLRYDNSREILWSVNEDGIDQGGSRAGGHVPHRQEDLVFGIIAPLTE